MDQRDTLWTDNSGKVLFNSPHTDLSRPNKLPGLFKKIKESGDDRSRSILVNLIMENLTDNLLGHAIKDYGSLIKKKRIDFYFKLSLLQSFVYMPDKIFTSVHCLREIRNRFAHRLEVTDFNDLDDAIKRMITLAAKNAFYEDTSSKSLEEKISMIEFHALVGLDIFEPNLKVLSEHINGEAFKEHLDETSIKRLKQQIDSMDDYIKSRPTNSEGN